MGPVAASGCAARGAFLADPPDGYRAACRVMYLQWRRERVKRYFARLLDEHKAARGAILTVTPVPVRTR